MALAYHWTTVEETKCYCQTIPSLVPATVVVPVSLCDDLDEVYETDVVVAAHVPGFEVELLCFGREN